ncbi:MAG: hypothetical protein HS107_10955 [Thermoflexaceae bacterium]|nr:hypothetical protein [Thermoflexaceae bacterium]
MFALEEAREFHERPGAAGKNPELDALLKAGGPRTQYVFIHIEEWESGLE